MTTARRLATAGRLCWAAAVSPPPILRGCRDEPA